MKLFFFLALFYTSSSIAAIAPDFVALAKKVNPAIVNISTKQRVEMDPRLKFLEEFYGFNFGDPNFQKPAQSLGSGFLIDESGLIITNNHVIEKADEIEVQINEDDETKYKAKVIGRDEKTDIALIKISAPKKLPYLKLGSSEESQVGEWVAAFGNPLGFGHSMSHGILSAKGREVLDLGIVPFLQTDASINPGNSGGPLVNLKGEVIGVNTFIIRGAEGLGFAVSIDGVKKILPMLKEDGRVTRGYIGIAISPVDPRAQRALGLKDLSGVLVRDVEPGGRAEKAGIQAFDVIKKVDGSEVTSVRSLQNLIARVGLGEKAKIEVIREGKTKKFNVTVGAPPKSSQSSLPRPNVKQKSNGTQAPYNLGFSMKDLTRSLATQYKIEYRPKKVVVSSIEPGSPAYNAGLQEGDVLLDINREKIRSVKAAAKALKKSSNLLRVDRENYRVAIFLEGE